MLGAIAGHGGGRATSSFAIARAAGDPARAAPAPRRPCWMRPGRSSACSGCSSSGGLSDSRSTSGSASRRPTRSTSTSPPSSGCGSSPIRDGHRTDRARSTSRGPAGQADHDLARRHPQLLRARLPHEAGRRSRAATPPLWFEATEPGTYQILCAEYCGTGHSTMRGEVVALDARRLRALARARRRRTQLAGPSTSARTAWSSSSRRSAVAAACGERVAAEHGCLRCHTARRHAAHRPDLGRALRLAGPARRTAAASIADEAYLTESMMDPRARLHARLPAGDAVATWGC